MDNVLVPVTTTIISQGSPLCGYYWADKILEVRMNSTHTSSTLSLTISTNIDSFAYDESFGIRELFVIADFVRLSFYIILI